METTLALAERSLDERTHLLESKLTEVERRLSGHAQEREEASRRRMRIEADLTALGRLASLVGEISSRLEALHAEVEREYREQLEAVRAGGLLFVSGQPGFDPATGKPGATIPVRGSFQRIRASAPTNSPLAKFIFGW